MICIHPHGLGVIYDPPQQVPYPVQLLLCGMLYSSVVIYGSRAVILKPKMYSTPETVKKKTVENIYMVRLVNNDKITMNGLYNNMSTVRIKQNDVAF